MKTKLEFSIHRGPLHVKPRSAALAAMLCAGMLATQPGGAQEAVEGGAIAKGTVAAPLPMNRGPMQMTISMAPVPAGAAGAAAAAAAAMPLRGPTCTGAVRGESTVVVPLGKSTLVPIDEPVRNRTVGNPAVAQATMVSPQTLYVVGVSVGSTNMIVQGRSGRCQIIDVVVNADAGGLQTSLSQLLPNEHNIRVSTAGDNLVLSGSATNSQAAAQALEIARVYSDHAAAAGGPQGGATEKGGVINMLAIDAPQQVMLEVKVAEVDKTLINQLGSAVNIQGGFGSWTGALVNSLLSGAAGAVAFSKSNKLPLQFALDAQKTDNLTKILAEPKLVTISGQEASFLAGGEVFIPVPQSSSNGATSIVLQEEEFGVALKFTPTVLAGGRINLKVAPEVSELSPTGVTLSSPNVSGVSILPLITTRRASTTVQMNDGETFAIGGLINNNVTGALKAFPGLGEVPVLGALMRDTNFQQDRTELVFIITPHLVKPLPNNQVPLPTDSFTQPSEADVLATGDMEGRRAAKAVAAPAGTAPSSSQMQAPAPANAPAPAPAHDEPADTAVTPKEPAPAETRPVATTLPVVVKPLVDTQNTGTSASGAPAPKAPAPGASAAVSDGQDARIARIEADAARIAAAQNEQPPAKPHKPSQVVSN